MVKESKLCFICERKKEKELRKEAAGKFLFPKFAIFLDLKVSNYISKSNSECLE